MITHVEVQSPDLCHKLGQNLLLPVSTLFGRFYRIENGVRKLPNQSLIARVIATFMVVILFPITLVASGLGALLLHYSSTYKKACVEIKQAEVSVVWKNGKPEIHTNRLLLRPIQAEDLPVYQALFNNAIAMAKYAGGGPRDITNRFNNWLGRWKEHSFSALAIVDAESKKVIGHTISGHGDFEGSFDKGWSEMAIVIEPAYWNSDFKDAAQGIGTAGKKGIGSEVVRAAVAYARSMKDRSIPVPSDVALGQRPQLEEVVRTRNLKVHRNAGGQIDWVYLPFTELRATSRRDNTGGYKALEQIFVKENQAVKSPKTAERDLFVVNL